jgi:hypothetical protein
MTNTLAEIGISLLGTAGTMAFVIPYIVGWAAIKALFTAPASKPTMAEALNQLDHSFATKHGEASE